MRFVHTHVGQSLALKFPGRSWVLASSENVELMKKRMAYESSHTRYSFTREEPMSSSGFLTEQGVIGYGRRSTGDLKAAVLEDLHGARMMASQRSPHGTPLPSSFPTYTLIPSQRPQGYTQLGQNHIQHIGRGGWMPKCGLNRV